MKAHPLRAPLITLAALWIGLAVTVWATFDQLPQRIATHFGIGGNPNAWMSRAALVTFLLGFAVGLPIVLHLLFVVSRAFQALVLKVIWLTRRLVPLSRLPKTAE